MHNLIYIVGVVVILWFFGLRSRVKKHPGNRVPDCKCVVSEDSEHDHTDDHH
jgi:hypothetical protein